MFLFRCKKMVAVALSAFAFIFFTSPAAMAGEKAEANYEIGAITVTAQKREENVQDVPMGIAVLSEVQIEDSGIEKVEDVVRYVPNLYMIKPSSHSGGSWFNMRGISGVPDDPSANPAVGFYVDGVYYSGGFSSELVDIERVEVLRGPQGTLYGRNTEAGVVHIVTKKPGNDFRGKASAGYGNLNSQDYSLALSGPLVKDKLFLGFAGKHSVSDGHMENDVIGSDETNDLDNLDIRTNLRWTPTDAWDIGLTSDFSRYRDGYDAWGPLNDLYNSTTDFKGAHEDQDGAGNNLKAEYSGGHFTLTSMTAVRFWDDELACDADMTAMDSMRLRRDLDFNTFSQEIRLASPAESGSLKWLLGGYYFNEEKNQDLEYDMRQGFPSWGIAPFKQFQESTIDSTGYALFGQTTLVLFDRLGLTGGLRYDHTTKELDFKEYYSRDLSGFGMMSKEFESDEETYGEWLPKVALDYRWTPDLMTYASYAKGFKGGGFNIYSGNSVEKVYDPEYSQNYEVGVKSSWLDKRLTANLAAFYIDWKDQQVSQFLSASEIIKTNAGKSTSKGFELEMAARPVTGLELTAGVGYTTVEFDDYKQDQFDQMGNKIGEKDFSGNTNALIPEYTYNLGMQYRSMEGLFGRVELQGVGEYYFDPENSKKQESYELVNARLGYEADFLEVVVWGKNLLDKEYAYLAIDQTGMGDWKGTGGAPRTFGVTLTKRF